MQSLRRTVVQSTTDSWLLIILIPIRPVCAGPPLLPVWGHSQTGRASINPPPSLHSNHLSPSSLPFLDWHITNPSLLRDTHFSSTFPCSFLPAISPPVSILLSSFLYQILPFAPFCLLLPSLAALLTWIHSSFPSSYPTHSHQLSPLPYEVPTQNIVCPFHFTDAARPTEILQHFVFCSRFQYLDFWAFKRQCKDGKNHMNWNQSSSFTLYWTGWIITTECHLLLV